MRKRRLSPARRPIPLRALRACGIMVEENERVEGNEMGIRLIVTDLDGTLLGDDHKGQ